MEPKYFEEQIFFVTLKVEVTDTASGEFSVGTGFLVQHPLQQSKDQSVVVLVTCRHVLFGGRGNVTLTFNSREAVGSPNANLGQTIKVGPASYDGAYHTHDDPEIDIVAVNVSRVIDQNPLIYFRSLGETNWVDFQNEKLLPTKDVIFVGYPIGFSDQMNNLPIVRAGKIASHPRVDFNGKPEYLIDAQVFPGSSGSPVFTILENVYGFCGMVGQSISRTVSVETIQVSNRQIVKDFVGLGVVYKPSAVLQVVKKVADSMATKPLS